jgi:SAM-dependent methyltransferase
MFGVETMFEKSAQWYDALYSFKDYAKEAAAIVSLLKEEHAAASSLLDVACGTAEHDRYLAQAYRVDGLDINEDFIRAAASKNPRGEYFCADMTDFDLGKSYDVILCLFSSIGYARTMGRVVQSLCCFERHLNADGIVVVEPWFTPETWNPDGRVHLLTAETPEGKICRMNISQEEEGISVIDFHYLVGTASGVEHFTERHELGLFSVNEMKEAFAVAHFAVRHDETGLTGRGLYIARKSDSEQSRRADEEGRAARA